MKLLHTYKLAENHIVKVFDNNSKSNYNRFVVTYLKGDKQAITGTTMKANTTREQFKKDAEQSLMLYYRGIDDEPYYVSFSNQRKELREEWNDTETDWKEFLEAAELRAQKVKNALGIKINYLSRTQIEEHYKSLYKMQR